VTAATDTSAVVQEGMTEMWHSLFLVAQMTGGDTAGMEDIIASL
jgi:hypothetical protein